MTTQKPKTRPVVDDRRNPPAFQDYASDALALEAVKLALLADLGLVWVCRLTTWVNGSIPRDPKSLARLIGHPAEEVEQAMQSDVFKLFFTKKQDDPTRMVCLELEAQRAALMKRRQGLSTGGKNAVKSREANKKLRNESHDAEHGAEHEAGYDAEREARHDGSDMPSEERREEERREEFSGEGFHDEQLDRETREAFDDPEPTTAKQYAKASGRE
jgi:hypothetical protein